MKKISVILMAVAVLGALVAGCSKGDDSSAAPADKGAAKDAPKTN